MLQVCFDCYGTYTTDSVYQWDLNRRLAIRGLDYDSAPAIHFSNKKSTEALVVQSTIEDGVIYCEVPNILLQEPYDIVGYVCESLDQELTTYETIRIPVNKRVKPADYAYEDNVEILTYYSLISEITSVKASTERDLRSMDASKVSKAELNLLRSEVESNLDTNISRVEDEIATERSRVDQLVASPDMGEGDFEKEVEDLRIDTKGTTHGSAGTAVREQIQGLDSKIDDNANMFHSLTNSIESGNLFSKSNAYHWYRSSTGIVKESVKTLTFIVPFTGAEYSLLNPYFGYSSNVYLRFLNGMPKAGENLADYQIASVKLTQEYQIRQVPDGTKYIWLTVRDESVNDTYTENDVYKNCMLIEGSYKREYIAPVNMVVTKDSLNDDLASILNSIYDGEPTVYSTNDSSVVAPSFVGNPSLMLTQLSYSNIIELFDSLGLGMVKSVIGYATTASGEEDTTRPIYCYTLRNQLNNGRGFCSNGRKLLVIAGQHGNEKNGVFGLYKILKEYADGVNLYLGDILDNLELDIIPVVNPYGFDNNTRDNARGVNINRNFDYYWESYTGTDKGAEKESEHETKAIVTFLNNHVNDYYGLVDIHCSTRYQGTEQLLAQMFANSTTLRQHFSSQISRCNRKWKKKYDLDIMALQIGCERDQNGATNQNGGLTGDIGNIPQLAGWFTKITNRFACEIEVPKHRTTYVGDTESGGEISNGYKYLWYGYPTPQISMDVIVATLSACDKTMDIIYPPSIENEPIYGAENE